MMPSKKKMKGCDGGSRESRKRSLARTFMRKEIVLGQPLNNNPAAKRSSNRKNVKRKSLTGTTEMQCHGMLKIRRITNSRSPT